MLKMQTSDFVTPLQSSFVEHFVYLAHLSGVVAAWPSVWSGLAWTMPRKLMSRTIRERNFILAPGGGRKIGWAEGSRRFIWFSEEGEEMQKEEEEKKEKNH